MAESHGYNESKRREIGFRGFMDVLFPDYPQDKVEELARDIREKYR